ncbi:hypothetical protein MMC22_002389 [Lobaria immixta]|nr:hypothetical protein [Lobaria immixta]
MATNATGGPMSPYSPHESEGIFNAADGLGCSSNELTGQSTNEEAPLEEQIRLMRDQLEKLQSRIQDLEHSTRLGQQGSVENRTKILQHEENSSKLTIVEEKGMGDQEMANQGPDDYELDDQESDGQDSDEQVSEDQEGVERKPVPTIPQLRRVEWSDFKNIYSNEKPLHAIDVLMGPARYYWQRDSEDPNIKHNPHSFRYKVTREASLSQEFDPKREQLPHAVPERIRVNSESILSIINDISIERVPTDKPQVFLQPYKLIVALDSKIRQRLKDLESKWANYTGTRNTGRGRRTKTSIRNALHTSYDGTAVSATSREAFVDGKPGRSLIDSFDALRDLRCLVEFMDNDISPVLRKYRSGSDFTKKVSFRNLWYLFKPGDNVLCTVKPDSSTGYEPDLQSIWRVLCVSEGRPHLSENNRKTELINPFKMTCFKIGYNGKSFGPITHFFEILPFEHVRDITSLDIIPIRMVEDPKSLIDQWRILGLKFKTYTVPQHQVYTGSTLSHHTNGERCAKVQRTENLSGSVIIDIKAAVREDEKWVPEMEIPRVFYGDNSETSEDFETCLWSDRRKEILVREIRRSGEIYSDDWVDREGTVEIYSKDHFLSKYMSAVDNPVQIDLDSVTDDDLILLPERICGFDLHRRCFALFDVKCLQSVDLQTEGWKDLKLLRGHKAMVQAQVQNHFAEKSFRARHRDQRSDIDLVRGKGEGLIILLHGTPGVGKTSTAECVAASLGKPLYPITCGDLGTSATELENGLYGVFSQAEAWDCVLLLDEADVFLAQRTRTDLDRNAIVSVFLRVLEYYKGILFLTTNRVGSFDEAFKSRIHLSLYYPSLNRDQTRAIWNMNLERMEKRKGRGMTIDRVGIVDFALRHFEENKKRNTRWNGRQIRNAFQTATALAEYEAAAAQKSPATLEVGHFETVAEASLQFDMYIAETIGADAGQRALLERTRADNFKWALNRDIFSSFRPSHRPYQTSAPNTNIDLSQSLYSPLHDSGYNHSPSPLSSMQGEGHSVHSTPQWSLYPSAPKDNVDYDHGNSSSRHISSPIHRTWPQQHAQGQNDTASTSPPFYPSSTTASTGQRQSLGSRIFDGRGD